MNGNVRASCASRRLFRLRRSGAVAIATVLAVALLLALAPAAAAIPNGTMNINYDAPYATSRNVTITSFVNGAATMRFRDSGQGWTGWQPYAATFGWTLPAGDGLKMVDGEYRDVLMGVLPLSDVIVLDTVPPSTDNDCDGLWHEHAVTVHPTASDATSGVHTTQYRLDGGSWQAYNPSTGIVVGASGEHALDYYSTDWAGNQEGTKSCTVRVDTVAPVTDDDAETAWVGVPVTVTLSPLDTGGSGVEHTDYRVDGGSWRQGTVIDVPAPSDGSNDGEHTIDYYSTDKVGNEESAHPCVVRIDTIKPQTSDDAPGAWRCVPVNVHLSPVDPSPGSGIASTRYRLDGGSWTGGTSVFVSGHGLHTIDYDSTDVAGNQELTHPCTVRIDLHAPISHDDYDGLWHTGDVNLHLTADDPDSGLASIMHRVDGGGWGGGSSFTVGGDGHHNVDYFALDNAGNEEVWRHVEVRIDTQAPHTGNDAPPGWRNSDVTVHLSAGDGVGIGVAHTYYNLDGGGWTAGSAVVVAAPSNHSNDGAHTIQYRSDDLLGHLETASSCEVRIDTQDPETTDDADGDWHGAPVTVAHTPGDSGGSGVASTEYRVDGGSWEGGAVVVVPAPSDGSNDGEHTIEYKSDDAAGNHETGRVCPVRIDTTPPETTDDAPAEAREEDVTVTLTAADDPPEGREGQPTSGVAATEYRLDGGDWTPGTEVVVTAPPDGSNDGEHLIEYRSSDDVGNVETAHTGRVLIDTTTLEARPWREEVSGVTDTLRGVCAVDEEEAWAVGLNGRVLCTTDGGATWVREESGTTQSFFDVVVNGGGGASGGCWVVGARGVLLRSTDAGASWQSRSFTTSNLNAVELVGPDTVWVAGAGGLLACSTDAGATWTPALSGTSETIFDLSFFDEERGWACGYAGVILATTDGGLTWEREESGTTQTLRSISFFDGETGCAVGAGGTMLRTTDAGTAWSSVSVTGRALFGVHTCGGGGGSGAYGWACGYDGLILSTSDAGVHWVDEPSGVSETLYAVDFTGDPVGWAVGVAGRVLYRDACAPVTAASAPEGWQTAPVTVGLTATDVGTGVARTRYCLDGGLWTDGVSVGVPAPGDGANDGVHVVGYRSTDNAGNTEVARTREVRIDTQAPVTTDNGDGLPHRGFLLELTPDDATSGVATTEYRIDGGSWRTGTSCFLHLRIRHKSPGLPAGDHLVEYRSTDAAGNVEEARRCTITLGY